MPPSSISSAIALVGLCALAAFETGGCSNSPKSLASVTRSGLPFLAGLLREPLSRVQLFKISDDGLGHAAASSQRDVGAAQGSSSTDSTVPGSHDVGLGSVPGLEAQCGRYEFKPDGSLVVWDALASRLDAERVATALSKQDPSLRWVEREGGSLVASRAYMGRHQQIEIRKRNKVKLPDSCSRPPPRDTQSVVIVAQRL